MRSDFLPCVEHEPARAARSSVIWLHGLGADGHDFEPILPMLGVDDLDVRFVFPHAPQQPVTINGGFVMPAWYDILGLGADAPQDESGILESHRRVSDLVTRENERGVPAERIVLAGFSQGGAIALHLALRHAERFAACVALSTYMVRGDSLEAERSEANASLPIFQAHGTLDPMVPHDRGADARARLEALGHEVEWHEYPMGHQVCEPEIDAIGAYLRRALG